MCHLRCPNNCKPVRVAQGHTLLPSNLHNSAVTCDLQILAEGTNCCCTGGLGEL